MLNKPYWTIMRLLSKTLEITYHYRHHGGEARWLWLVSPGEGRPGEGSTVEGSCDAFRDIFCTKHRLQCVVSMRTLLRSLHSNETHRPRYVNDWHRRRDLAVLLAHRLYIWFRQVKLFVINNTDIKMQDLK